MNLPLLIDDRLDVSWLLSEPTSSKQFIDKRNKKDTQISHYLAYIQQGFDARLSKKILFSFGVSFWKHLTYNYRNARNFINSNE